MRVPDVFSRQDQPREGARQVRQSAACRLRGLSLTWLPSVSRHAWQGRSRLGGDGPRRGLSEEPVLGL